MGYMNQSLDDGSGGGGNYDEDEIFQAMLAGGSEKASVPMSMEQSGDGGAGTASLVGAGASGAAAGGPMGAGIAVGGSLLTSYLAQKAATERQKRAQAVAIENEYTKNMGDSLAQKLAAFRGALR